MPADFGLILQAADVYASPAGVWPMLRQSRGGGAVTHEHADGTPAQVPSDQEAEGLADNAIQRNVFVAPWMMRAAEAHLLGGGRVHTLVSRRQSELVGLVPVLLPQRSCSLPVATVWAHMHSFETTPLVRDADRFFDDLFFWLQRNRVAALRWPRLSLDGPFIDRLSAYLGRSGRMSGVVASHSRPVLLAGGDGADGGIRHVISKKRLREIDRCRRRLGEHGVLAFRSLDHAGDGDRWASDFLRLEASGWKGAAGRATALACRGTEHAFFLRVFQEALRRGQLVAHRLDLDGEPIAMTVNYRSGDIVWAYKTAYDENYAKFGPGAVLEVEGTQAMIEDPRIAWVDSCSDGDNAFVNEIWPSRREVGDMLIAVKPGRSLLVPGMLMAERARLTARARLRAAYWQIAERLRR